MATCEGVIPETEVLVGYELVPGPLLTDEEGEPLLDEEGQQQRGPATAQEVRENAPEHPCDQEATTLARSMTEQVCNLDGVHWVTTEDRVYCGRCFVPGSMTHLDGRVTEHQAMAVE
jgi:hypothetical protein